MHTETQHTHHISWSAIIVGALVAVGLSALFHLLSSGLGLSTFTRTETGVLTLMIGGLIWLVVGGYIILFVAGYVTGKLACENCANVSFTGCHGALHGFIAWCLALIILILTAGPIMKSANISIPTTATAISNTSEQYLRTETGTKETVTDKGTERAINKIGLLTLSTFFVFLASALGSTIGGYYAIKSKCNSNQNNNNPNKNL